MNTTIENFRAEAARLGVKRYRLAAIVGINPSRLGGILSGRIPLREDLAEKIEKALLEVKKRGAA